MAPAPELLIELKHWSHFQIDDIELGRQLNEFNAWPNGERFLGIDFCFIDTSHYYDHTIEELSQFWPLGSQKALYIFHDTNLSESTNRRLDGSLNTGWDNTRGVARALEDFFEIKLQDEDFFLKHKPTGDIALLMHIPWCNGLTIIQKA